MSAGTNAKLHVDPWGRARIGITFTQYLQGNVSPPIRMKSKLIFLKLDNFPSGFLYDSDFTVERRTKIDKKKIKRT